MSDINQIKKNDTFFKRRANLSHNLIEISFERSSTLKSSYITEIDEKYFHNGGKKFDDLNDESLLKIFSMLRPIDLCALFYTCKRFQSLAESLFPVKFIKGNDWIWNKYENFIVLVTGGPYVERFVHTESLDSFVDADEKYNKALHSSSLHCTKMKCLTFVMCRAPRFLQIYGHLFDKLEEIRFYSCTFDEYKYKNFIKMCSNLKRILIIGTVGIDCRWLMEKFPHLEAIDMDDEDRINAICEKNTQIKKARFLHVGETLDLSNINPTNFEELHVNYSAFESIPNKLKKLRSLALSADHHHAPFAELCKNMPNLEDLQLFYGDVRPHFFKQILELKKLRSLGFLLETDDDYFVEFNSKWLRSIGTNLINLEKLALFNVKYLCKVSLIDFIESAKNLCDLTILTDEKFFDDKIFSKIGQIFAQRKRHLYLRINSNTLNVSKKVFDSYMQHIKIVYFNPCYGFDIPYAHDDSEDILSDDAKHFITKITLINAQNTCFLGRLSGRFCLRAL